MWRIAAYERGWALSAELPAPCTIDVQVLVWVLTCLHPTTRKCFKIGQCEARTKTTNARYGVDALPTYRPIKFELSGQSRCEVQGWLLC